MKKILYHAISAYQLFEVIVHRLRFHKKDYVELLLPDFIESKYSNWRYLEEWGIFQKVSLLDYMQIPHMESTVLADMEKKYGKTGLLDIENFDEIYVAGVHFYFALYLADKKVYFNAFEDAPGMINDVERLENNLIKTYPVQAKLSRKYEMIDMSSCFIKKIITTDKRKKIADKVNQYFNVLREVKKLKKEQLQLVWGFYHLSKWSECVSGSVIILTQCFSTLGIMTQEQQEFLYRKISKILCNEVIYIKKHPDDKTNYNKIFSRVRYLPDRVPVEILACKFKGKPKYMLTISSTSNRLLKEKYKMICLSDYSPNYSYINEFDSAKDVIDKWSNDMERKWVSKNE